MESKHGSVGPGQVDLAGLFNDLVRLETELWGVVDHRLREEHDLPLSWFEPMQIVDQVADCRVIDIANSLSITVGGVSKLVDRIERAGWCARARNPKDARSSLVTLTRAGQRVLRAAEGSFGDELAGRLGAAVPPARLASFASTVRDLRLAISNQRDSAR